MKCTLCGLKNPDTAIRCDCGYDFCSGEINESYLKQDRVEEYTALTRRIISHGVKRHLAIAVGSLWIFLMAWSIVYNLYILGLSPIALILGPIEAILALPGWVLFRWGRWHP